MAEIGAIPGTVTNAQAANSVAFGRHCKMVRDYGGRVVARIATDEQTKHRQR